jgi:hypothetical protein
VAAPQIVQNRTKRIGVRPQHLRITEDDLSVFNFYQSASLRCLILENEQSKQNILFTTKITSQNLPTQAQIGK